MTVQVENLQLGGIAVAFQFDREGQTMFGFLLGALTAGTAAYYWHEQIKNYINRTGVPTMRDRAADRLGDVGARAVSALDRTRSSVEAGVRKGQERLRSTGTSGREPGAGQSYTAGVSPLDTGRQLPSSS